MDGQYWKGDRTMSTNDWLLTSDFWQFLEPWHGRWYENEIFIASCTDNIYDLENERWLLGDMIDHVGIYGSRVAEGLSAFSVGLVLVILSPTTIHRHFFASDAYCSINIYSVVILTVTYSLFLSSPPKTMTYRLSLAAQSTFSELISVHYNPWQHMTGD